MERATFGKTPISRSTQEKFRCPGTSSNLTPRMKSQHEVALTLQLPPPEKAAGSKYNSTSGLTCSELFERNAEFHASIQDEARLPYSNSAETLRSMSEMERNPEVSASIRNEALFNPAAMHEEYRGSPRNTRGDLTSLMRQERDVRSTRNSRGTLSFSAQLHANH